ncbi:hypothetical protein [Deinococcus radiophilus]|uniref:hypothetical protein n=1 Tax=Deinococcus radiophilus TaxID=32062 RepID=UPI0036185DCE
MKKRRTHAAQVFHDRLRGVVDQYLLNYDAGPKYLLDLFAGVEPRIGELRSWQAGEQSNAVEQTLGQLQEIQSNTLLGMFFLKGKASQRLIGGLNRALNADVKVRLDQKVIEGLSDGASASGTRRMDPGTLTLISDETRLVTDRLNSLRKRLINQSDRWRMHRSSLENDSAAVNGLSLFEPSPNGSVEKEEELAVDDRQIEAHAIDLIRSWTDLNRGILPGANDPDWLRMPWSPGQDNFERSQLDRLEQKALEPFESRLKGSGKDIITRLEERRSPSFDPGAQAIHASDKARIFLNVNEPLGQLDPMSPLPRRKLLISKRMTPEFRRSLQPWSNANPGAKEVEGVDPNRVVMLEEWYRFALRGADDVREMSFATPTRFNTY